MSGCFPAWFLRVYTRSDAHNLAESTMRLTRVCSTAEAPEVGQSKLFVVDGQRIGVFNVDGSLFALANDCPHAGASLAHGELNGDVIACRIHHWRFCVRDGVYLDENISRWNAATYRLEITADEILVEL